MLEYDGGRVDGGRVDGGPFFSVKLLFDKSDYADYLLLWENVA